MPLFSNKFIPKSIPPRKISSGKDSSQQSGTVKSSPGDPVSADLGSFKAYFHNGRWSTDGGKPSDGFESTMDLREKLLVAQEEINMLRLKEEILIDMVTDLTIQLKEKNGELSE